jgi:predicted nucleotidyltransferase
MHGEMLSADQRPFRLINCGLEHDLAPVDDDVFASVLRETVEALEKTGIPYAIVGGLATYGFGRPRTTCDIDLFVLPRDAERVLSELAERGFQTERTDEKWIYKAFKSHVQVDIIFMTAGFYFDDEMARRSVEAEAWGTRVRFIPPEDLVVIKAKCATESAARHWHDALAVLASCSLDWEYLLRRAGRAERRVLSLLLYAQSNDVHVPASVIKSMFGKIFES